MRKIVAVFVFSLVLAGSAAFATQAAHAQSAQEPASGDELFARGVRAFQAGRLQRALELFRADQRRRPNDARIANALGNALFALNQPEAAAAQYRRALHLDHGLTAARKNLGILEFHQRDFGRAEGDLRAAARLLPQDATVWRFLGRCLAIRGQSREAIEALKHSLALDAADTSTRLELAGVEASAGDRASALADLRALAKSAALTPAQVSEVGERMLSLGDAPDAVALLQQYPGNDQYAMELARAQMQAHDFAGAGRTLEAALPLAHDPGAVLDMLGSVEQQSNSLTQAGKAYRQSIFADPRRPEPYLHLSWLYAETRHFAEAATTLREGLRFVQDRYPLEVQLGTVLVLEGREREALPHLEAAIAAEPDNPLAYTTSIIAYTLIDPSLKQAQTVAERALQRCPSSYLVHYLYAGVLLRENREHLHDPAMAPLLARISNELRTSIRLNPAFPHSHYDLARLEFDDRQYGVAENEARQTLAADATFTSAHYLLGQIYLRQGQRERGLAEIKLVADEHKTELQRIQAVGQSLLTGQASSTAANIPATQTAFQTAAASRGQQQSGPPLPAIEARDR